MAVPHGLESVQDVLVDPTRGEERDAVVVVAGEDGPAASVGQRHHDLQRPLGQPPGIVRSDHELCELIDQVYSAFHAALL
jgi:hypothetical protein